MIDVKEAAKRAAEYFASLYDPNTYADLELEEVELTEDERFWLITLGYRPIPKSPLEALVPDIPKILKSPSGLPKYKQFKIDAETGKVQAMMIRKVS